jgi:hypothetical protein
MKSKGHGRKWCCLIYFTGILMERTVEKYEKPQSGQSVSWLKYELSTS